MVDLTLSAIASEAGGKKARSKGTLLNLVQEVVINMLYIKSNRYFSAL